MKISFTDTGFSFYNFYTKVNPPCYGCTYKKMINEFPFYIDPVEIQKFIGIVIHHSATRDGKTYSWPSMKKYHMSFRIDGHIIATVKWIVNEKGVYTGYKVVAGNEQEYWKRKKAKKGKRFIEPWKDIAYEYGIEEVNGKLIYTLGRPLSMWGGHTKGHPKLIGICDVGNFDLKEPSKARYFMTAGLCRAIMKANTKITIDKIKPHSYYAKKTCPGSKFNLDKLKELIAKEI